MLCKDWACAMPAPPGHAFDVSFSMAQRLARRFHRQIFLSVDVVDHVVRSLLQGHVGVMLVSHLGEGYKMKQ
ncbi:hypothetical protein C8R48DRAFT_729170 [Suillus tomentosus]|nr:hypothetical protein C8R48DRAFT_729170 [Suillus tomentosus]